MKVLVLGGSGVLGSAIAAELADRGSAVMLSGRDRTRLKEKAASLGHVPTAAGDLGVAGVPRLIIDSAVELLGGLDGIVNAAGAVAFGTLDELDDDVLERLTASNFTGPLRSIREAIRHMDEGFVVSISGAVAETPMAGMAAYSGLKAGLSAATLALGRELRSRRIHVLDARPPHTETGLAGRPLAGTAPALPKGLAPDFVARRIVDALEAGSRQLAVTDFAAPLQSQAS